MGYSAELYYFNFFDIDIPLIHIYFGTSDIIFHYSSTFFNGDTGFENFPDNFLGDLFNNYDSPESSSSTEGLNTSESSYSDELVQDAILEYLSFLGTGAAIAGTTVCVISSILECLKSAEPYKKAITFISFGVYILSIILLITTLTITDNEIIRIAKISGLGYGLLLAGIFLLCVSGFIDNTFIFMARFYKILVGFGKYTTGRIIVGLVELFDFFSSFIFLGFDVEEVIDLIDWDDTTNSKIGTTIGSLIAGAVALFLSFATMLIFGGQYDRLTKSGTDKAFAGSKLKLD